MTPKREPEVVRYTDVGEVVRRLTGPLAGLVVVAFQKQETPRIVREDEIEPVEP